MVADLSSTDPSATPRLLACSRQPTRNPIFSPVLTTGCSGSDVRGGCTVMPAERAVEIGQVAEPDLEGEIGGAPLGKGRISQQAVYPGEPLAEDMSRKYRVLRGKQHLNIPRCHADRIGRPVERQFRSFKVLADV